jgi:hypothetical protein
MNSSRAGLIFNSEEIAFDFKEVAASIFVANAMPKSVCDEILAEFPDSEQWCQAKVAITRKDETGHHEIVGVVDLERRDALRIRSRDWDPIAQRKTRRYLGLIQKAVGDFASAEFGLDFSEFGDAEIIRYGTGGEFKPHADTHSENAQRAFTVILYLNEGFTGGETAFPDIKYIHKCKSGDVLFFPANELHASLPITDGGKTIIIFWILFPGTLGRKKIYKSAYK